MTDRVVFPDGVPVVVSEATGGTVPFTESLLVVPVVRLANLSV